MLPKGMEDIKGLKSTKGMRSFFREATSAGLDLYMLQKKKERLVKEDSMLERRKAEVQRKLKDISEEMETLSRGIPIKTEDTESLNMKQREWKKVKLNY